jgi:hypothetical protein
MVGGIRMQIAREEPRQINKKEVAAVVSVILLAVLLFAAYKSPFYREYVFKKSATAYLRERMKDPDSLKIIEWGKLEAVPEKDREKHSFMKEAYWVIRVKYSGTNSYGGRVSTEVNLLLNADGVCYYDYGGVKMIAL